MWKSDHYQFAEKTTVMIDIALPAQVLNRQCFPTQHCWFQPQIGNDHTKNTASLYDELAVLFNITLPSCASNR